jgi:hypothetical protein
MTVSLPEHRKQCRVLKPLSFQQLRRIERQKYTGFFTFL